MSIGKKVKILLFYPSAYCIICYYSAPPKSTQIQGGKLAFRKGFVGFSGADKARSASDRLMKRPLAAANEPLSISKKARR